MSDVDEYEIHKGDMTLQEMHRADAAIAELEAENERLKCCGNCAVNDCKSWSGEDGPFPYTWSRCQFHPSRWTARAEEDDGTPTCIYCGFAFEKP